MLRPQFGCVVKYTLLRIPCFRIPCFVYLCFRIPLYVIPTGTLVSHVVKVRIAMFHLQKSMGKILHYLLRTRTQPAHMIAFYCSAQTNPRLCGESHILDPAEISRCHLPTLQTSRLSVSLVNHVYRNMKTTETGRKPGSGHDCAGRHNKRRV